MKSGSKQIDLSINSLYKRVANDGIIRGASSAFIYQVVGAALGYVSQIILARFLGVKNYGIYTYVLAWGIILSNFSQFGFPTSVLRFIPEYRVQKRWALLKGVIFRSSETAFLGGMAISGCAMVVLYIFSNHIDPIYLKSFSIGIWVIPLYSLINLLQGMGKALKNMTLAYAPNSIIRPVFVIIGIILISFLYNGISSETALIITLAGFLIAVILQSVVLYLKLPDSSRKIKSEYASKYWFSVSLPLLLVASFYIFLNRIDVLMLGMLSSSENVGIYNAASRTSELVRFVPLAVNAIAAPTIAQLYAENKWEEMQGLAEKFIKITFWPSLFLCIGLFLFSSIIFGLFGHNFIEGKSILNILLIGQIVNAGAGAVGYFLNMTGHQKSTAIVFGWSALINIVLNIIGISLFGALGAALATTITLVIWNVWMNALVKSKLNIRPSIIYALHRQ